MNIAILAPYTRPWDLSDAEGSGINVVVRQSAQALAQAGHQVTVYIRASRPNDPVSQSISNNLTIRFLLAGSKEKLSREEVYHECKTANIPIEEICANDLIIAHYWISEAWSKQVINNFSGKILYISHSFGFDPFRSPATNLQLRAENWYTCHCFWGAMTKSEYEIMREIAGDRVILLYPGVELAVTLSGRVKKGNAILFVGRKNKVKGFDLFCRLAQDFPEEKFVAIGREGGDENKINLPNLQSLPFVSYNKVSDYIHNAKVLIAPSRYEHFGLTPLFAQFSHLPVIATERGCFPEIITDGKTGFLCEQTYKSLRNKFAQFLQMKPTDFDWSKWEDKKDDFSWKKFVDKIEGLIMMPEKVFAGQVMTVFKTPKIFKERLVNYESVQLSGSVHVIPVTRKGELIFLREKRIDAPQKGYQQRIISGRVDKGEDFVVAAQRELLEEAGLKARKMTLLAEFAQNNVILDQRKYYVATGLTVAETNHEKSEDIVGIVKLTKQDVKDALSQGEMSDISAEKQLVLMKVCDMI